MLSHSYLSAVGGSGRLQKDQARLDAIEIEAQKNVNNALKSSKPGGNRQEFLP